MEYKEGQNYLSAAMRVINEDSYSRSMYEYLKKNKVWSERFTAFLTGAKTLPLLYDPFFKKIFNPVENRDRLSELVSCLLGQKVMVLEVFPNEDSQYLGIFVIMDMVVRMSDGSIANIEIQKVPYDFPAERISCYSADLVLRQYKMLTGSELGDADMSKSVSYKSMRKVHTIIFFENSSASLISDMDKSLYYHIGRTTFNTGIQIELLQDFLLISLDTFKKYRYSDIKEGCIEVTDYDFDGTQYKADVSESMKLARLKYMSLFVAESADEINRLVELFPDLEKIRRDINEYLVTPKEVLNMFSEALRILDRNTANLMVDRFKEEIDDLKAENDELKSENDKKDLEIARLREQLETLNKE